MEQTSGGTEEVQKLLSEIESKDNKALVLILDKEADKAADIAQDFNDRGYVTAYESNGEKGLRFYKLFRQANPNIPVIVIMDSMFGPETHSLPYNTGLETAQEMIALSEANGWENSLFVGGSSQGVHNNALQQAVPEGYYISAYRTTGLPEYIKDGIFAQIATKVNPRG